MRTRLRAKVAAAAVAIIAGGVLALFATSGPAVAFFSGGLFLDVQVESPATLVAKGAAVDVPLEVTCNASPDASVGVTVTQKAGSGVAQGTSFTSVGCTGSSQQIRVRVQATSGGKTFKQGTAVASAEIFGCARDFSVCGRETDSQVIDIKR
ncbi:MAG TPA: hypothetical protein VFA46_18770 [Actinomycetes bacterium]|jgi:hypothetical protein|nr:hypothetical protein [Actinomycetes bacterium]